MSLKQIYVQNFQRSTDSLFRKSIQVHQNSLYKFEVIPVTSASE